MGFKHFGLGTLFQDVGLFPASPPPPPPPPNPATYASGSVQEGGAQAATQAAAAAGAGFDQTLAGSPQGSGSGNTAKSQLGG
jgi:hypothetical protein